MWFLYKFVFVVVVALKMAGAVPIGTTRMPLDAACKSDKTTELISTTARISTSKPPPLSLPCGPNGSTTQSATSSHASTLAPDKAAPGAKAQQTQHTSDGPANSTSSVQSQGATSTATTVSSVGNTPASAPTNSPSLGTTTSAQTTELVTSTSKATSVSGSTKFHTSTNLPSSETVSVSGVTTPPSATSETESYEDYDISKLSNSEKGWDRLHRIIKQRKKEYYQNLSPKDKERLFGVEKVYDVIQQIAQNGTSSSILKVVNSAMKKTDDILDQTKDMVDNYETVYKQIVKAQRAIQCLSSYFEKYIYDIPSCKK